MININQPTIEKCFCGMSKLYRDLSGIDIRKRETSKGAR